MSHVRTSLAHRMPRPPTPETDLEDMRRRAWRQQGVVTLRLADILDPWLRQGLINEAEKRWGKLGHRSHGGAP